MGEGDGGVKAVEVVQEGLELLFRSFPDAQDVVNVAEPDAGFG